MIAYRIYVLNLPVTMVHSDFQWAGYDADTRENADDIATRMRSPKALVIVAERLVIGHTIEWRVNGRCAIVGTIVRAAEPPYTESFGIRHLSGVPSSA